MTTKLKKFTAEILLQIFFMITTCNLSIPMTSQKENASALKREHPALVKKHGFLTFSIFRDIFALLDPDQHS
jgi:hypothetical protein